METELIAGIGGAFLGAILTGLFAWWLHQAEQLSFKKDELRKILMHLFDLQERFQEILTINPQHQEAAGLLINNKRLIFLEAAETLVKQIRKHVSSSEYASLAYEFWRDANFLTAEKYYLKSVDAAASTSIMKVFSLRALAAFYFGQGPARDFNKGRAYFEKATDLLKNPADTYSLYTLGYTYELWGLNELWNGFDIEGNTLVDRAIKNYKDLPDNNPLKNQSLTWLEIKLKQLRGADAKGQVPGVLNAPMGSQLAPVRTGPSSDSEAG